MERWQDYRDQYVRSVPRAVVGVAAKRTAKAIWGVLDDSWEFHKRRYREWKSYVKFHVLGEAPIKASGRAPKPVKWVPRSRSERMEESKEVEKAVGKAMGSRVATLRRVAALHRTRVPVTGRVSLSSIRRGRGRRRSGRGRRRSSYRRGRYRRRSYRRY